MLLEFDGTFIFALISFIVFVVIMNLILYRPILKIMDERQKFLDKNKETALQSKQKAADVLKQKDDEILGAKLEASNILTESQNEVKLKRENAIKAKKDEIKEELIKHSDSLKADKSNIKNQLKTEINDFVKMTVSKVLDENIETVDISEERINKAMEGKI